MNSQNIHDVEAVKAHRFLPSNSNAITIVITSRGVPQSITMYMGTGTHAYGRARALWDALGGADEDVSGTKLSIAAHGI